jgi:hypothetical protein
MFSPESNMGNSFSAQSAKPENPFHGIRRMARKGMGFPKLGLAAQGSPDIANAGPTMAGGPQPGQQAGTLFGSFGNQNKGFKAPRF